MALRNPEGLYSGGNVVLDSSPSVNFYAQHMARKQAKQDALDEYYKRLPGTINAAGMRDVDRPTFDKQIAEIQDFWIKNKDKLRNPRADNGAAQLEYENRVRQAGRLVDESKQRGKMSLELGQMKFDPSKSYIFDDEGIINQLHAHDLPIGANGSKGLEMSSIVVPPKPFDQDKYFNQYSGVKRGKSVSLDPQNRGDFTIIETTKSEFDKPGLDAIRNLATNAFKADKSFNSFVRKKLDSDEALKDLNPVFKKHYGKDIESYEDFATAYTLSGLQPEVTDTKEKPDTFSRQKVMESIRQGNRLQLAYVRQGFQQLREDQKENRINAIINDQIVEADANPEKEISLNPVISKEFAIADRYGDKQSPKATRIVNGRVELEYPNGEKRSIGIQDYKATLRKVFNQPVTPEDAAKPVIQKPKEGTYKIKGKTYSEAELLKMGYTLDDIKPYRQ